MSETVPAFGRRRAGPTAAPAAPVAPVPPPPVATAPVKVSVPQPLAELRALCLGRLDPAAVASTPHDRLIPEVERVVADPADVPAPLPQPVDQHGLGGEHDPRGVLGGLVEDAADDGDPWSGHAWAPPWDISMGRGALRSDRQPMNRNPR